MQWKVLCFVVQSLIVVQWKVLCFVVQSLIVVQWKVLCFIVQSLIVVQVENVFVVVVQLLLSEEEVKIKTEMWMKENEDYLVLQKGSSLSFSQPPCMYIAQHNS